MTSAINGGLLIFTEDVMGEYFTPWRRRVGCVLLVMAALLTASWIRSLRSHKDLWIDTVCLAVMAGHGDGRIFVDCLESDGTLDWQLKSLPHDLLLSAELVFE